MSNEKTLEELKQEAIAAGFDIPEDTFRLDEVENVAEPEDVDYD